MTTLEAHQQRMSDPVYGAAVRAGVAQAPPLADEQRQSLRATFHGSVLPAVEHRKTA